MMIAERYDTGFSRSISDSQRKSPNSEFCDHAVSIELKSLPTKTLKLHIEKTSIAQFSITESYGLVFRNMNTSHSDISS